MHTSVGPVGRSLSATMCALPLPGAQVSVPSVGVLKAVIAANMRVEASLCRVLPYGCALGGHTRGQHNTIILQYTMPFL